jgi:hypothetical protein
MKKIIIHFFLITIVINIKAQLNNDVINSKLELANQYLKGINQVVNPIKAFALHKECAEAGNSIAMNATGVHYRLGLGVETNFKEAFNWFEKSAKLGYGSALYNLGLMYKYGNASSIDYSMAYHCFEKASLANNPSGWYAQGYMLYKGLGCLQDYRKAVELFRRGVSSGKPNCMYFLGLALRNGYGTPRNIDSANYWLLKAARLGYNMASDELATLEPENAEIAEELIKNIKEIQNNSSKIKIATNKYIKIDNSAAASDIEGNYEGYIMKYDWAGQQIISASRLKVKLIYQYDSLKGEWIEDDTLKMNLQAILTPINLVFKNMNYAKIGHYNKVRPEALKLEKASLSFIKSKDTLFLVGNVQMFATERLEPAKPITIALRRTSTTPPDSTKRIKFINEDGSSLANKPLSIYPNPFTEVININFEIKQPCKVYTQLFTLSGKIVYSNIAGILEAGSYKLPLQPTQIAAGTYILKLQCGNSTQAVKIIKL